MYYNYPYGLFNQAYLKRYQMQTEVNRQWEQNKNITDMVKALSDFLKASEKVDADYQQQAFDACMSTICMHMANKNGGKL
ncbi:MAG: hypothetical protein Q4F41_06140 [Eubacteriales bacterium]|nr:hypothetical protein [Eubacteriales bacterium]